MTSGGAPACSPRDFYVLASTNAGLALLGMGRGEHAGDVYDEWIADHANEPSPDLVLRTDALLGGEDA